ncbi:hypothetical protein ABZ707_18995 [Streptomyces sp. NPDC006923]|uniref:hypothetical protein n=1 Tax=Streptomyces sp. NPDC006923 TaxID=3155355 RepID=UPI0033D2290B
MQTDLSPLIAATAQWLGRAFPSTGGAVAAALSALQVRQAVTVAAWLRYPTSMDVAVVLLAGPGGSARLDRVASGAEGARQYNAAEIAWRSWVDEVVASWAACLLADPALARAAVSALAGSDHMGGAPMEFRRLVAPDSHDLAAAALTRHPDLLEPITELHHAGLLDRLGSGRSLAR